ncbi:MAG: hypothetical protein QOF06_2405 [Solirubrobacterales bacterium]|nr:hypothetical protein [Solirubrobacterales bacterium]
MKIVFLTQPPAGGQDRREMRFLDGVSAALRDQGHQAEALATLDPETDLDDADLVVVHEANDLPLIARIGAHRARHGGYRLLFHDTHPRAYTASREMRRYDFSNYDGVLTPSEAVRCAHLEDGRTERAWIWREAVDTRLFHPLPAIEPDCDVVWIGDWSAIRNSDLRALLLRPARQLRMRGHLHISDAPPSTRFRVRLAGLHCRGSVADAQISAVFARHRLTVDFPQRAETAPGTPTTGFLQALACGVPLISTPWEDTEGLFQVERDYLIARDRAEMREAMQAIVEFPEFADELREHGLATVRAGNTCAHRGDELLAIDAELRGATLELAG